MFTINTKTDQISLESKKDWSPLPSSTEKLVQRMTPQTVAIQFLAVFLSLENLLFFILPSMQWWMTMCLSHKDIEMPFLDAACSILSGLLSPTEFVALGSFRDLFGIWLTK